MFKLKTFLHAEISRHAAFLGGLMLFWLFVSVTPAWRELAVPEHMANNIIPTVLGWLVGSYLAAYGLLWVADSYRRGGWVMVSVLAALAVGWVLRSVSALVWALLVVYSFDMVGQKLAKKRAQYQL